MSEREFPKTYLKFEGKKVVNGERKQFWVQDATEDLFEEIEYQLLENFIGDEPTTRFLKCKEDPQSMAEFRILWRNILQEKYTIVCLTKDDQNNTKLAGFNMLTESKADEKNKDLGFKGVSSTKLFGIFEWIEAQRNMHEEFQLPRIMKALGLYVLLDYRGEGFGERILEAREYICRHVGIPATLTAFTSVISQKLAARVGFKDFYTIEFKELGRIDPSMEIPDIQTHTKLCKYMYKIYN